MKKYSSILLIIAVVLFAACNDGNKNDKNKKADEKKEMKGFVEYDISPHGYPVVIMIPDENTGLPQAEVTGWGAVDLVVGQNFGLRVEMGEGDIELLKRDLEEDLVYEAKIIEEKPDYLLYKKVIPGADLDSEYHFFYTTDIDGATYEIKNLKSEIYTEKAAKKMLKAAKTLRKKKPGENKEGKEENKEAA